MAEEELRFPWKESEVPSHHRSGEQVGLKSRDVLWRKAALCEYPDYRRPLHK